MNIMDGGALVGGALANEAALSTIRDTDKDKKRRYIFPLPMRR